MVRACPVEQPVGGVEQREGAVAVAALHARHRVRHVDPGAQHHRAVRELGLSLQAAQGPPKQDLGARGGARSVREDRFLDEAGDVVVEVRVDPGLRSPRSA